MEKDKSFLDAWKVVMDRFVEQGTIEKEEIDDGFEISYEGLQSSLISKKTIVRAMRDIHEKEFPKSKYPLDKFQENLKIILDN